MLSHVERNVSSFWRDDTGSAIIPVALAMPIFVGILAFAIDMSWYQSEKSRQRGVAEMAALAGYNARLDGATVDQARQVAINLATTNGFTDGVNGVTVTANTPPSSGPSSNNQAAYEVIIKAPQPTWFSSIFRRDNSKPILTGRGVAAPYAIGPACILTLHTGGDTGVFVGTSGGVFGGTGQAAFSNTTGVIQAPGCSVASNDAVKGFQFTTAQINAALLTTPANINITSGNVNAAIMVKAPPTPDPYANFNLPMPAATSCWQNNFQVDTTNAPITGTKTTESTVYYDQNGQPLAQPYVTTTTVNLRSITLDPPPSGMAYCGGITIATSVGGPNLTVNFNPGIYYFLPSAANPAKIQGTSSGILNATSGVTFVFSASDVAAAGMKFTSLDGLNITAPTTGPTAGIAIYIDRKVPSPVDEIPPTASAFTAYIYNNALQWTTGNSVVVEGDIYMPTQIQRMTGGSFTFNCGRFIAFGIQANGGNYTFNNPTDGSCSFMTQATISAPTLVQ